jgi:beta-lactamase superfamily II metal-dependent hydrolase
VLKEAPAIRIAFLDVGQGDTIVISSPETGEAIVVDCIDANAVLEYLEQEEIKYLRGIVITHLHDDHYCQVDDLLFRANLVPNMRECEMLACGNIPNRKFSDQLMQDIYDRLKLDSDGHQQEAISDEPKQGKMYRTTVLQNIRDWCQEDKRRYIYPSVQGEVNSLPFKGTLARNIYLIHPYALDLFNRLETKGLNNTSVVLHIISSSSSVLLTGDLEPVGWKLLQENRPYLHSDVLKFPHHGGNWNAEDTKSLLDAVQPSVVVISVGTVGEKYKHPNKEVFQTLALPEYSHIQVLCTQATNQCQMTVSDQRQAITQLLDRQASSRDRDRVGSRRGCPCAGTIIIELGDSLRVIQPSRAFHQDSIIIPHLLTHKCVLAPIHTISASSDMDTR